LSTGGTDGILMVWKSNVRNMDQEFESLSKNSMAQMKSNKKKIEEENNKTLQNSKSMTTSNNKYKVIPPKSETIKPEVKAEKSLVNIINQECFKHLQRITRRTLLNI
jgi:hypothetical protein